MGELRSFDKEKQERRREVRTETDLTLMVWGVDTKGERFLQEAHAHDISLSGAMLSGIDTSLTSGDVIGVLFAGKTARYRVVWVRYDCGGDKMQVAIHRNPQDGCPWQNLLSNELGSNQGRGDAPEYTAE